jgi:cytochrome c-type biogenesis protein CcmH/NrfF
MKHLSTLRNWALLILLCASLAASKPAHAQGEAASNDTMVAIAKQLVCPCPSCGGKALDLCHKNCGPGDKHRAEIAGLLRENKTREEIMQFFAASYGASILGTPPAKGFGSLAVWTPLAALLLGVVPLWLFTRRSSSPKKTRMRGRGKRATDTQRGDDERVAAELRDFDY